MIIKSMSRKEPSFGQLAAYMSDAKSERSFDLHHNLFARDPGAIAQEFSANAARLKRRRGGNYLYHEILSIDTRECGQDREVKEKLRLLALEFIDRRCRGNLVYGALHRDHTGHLHYHLMISANERGEAKRHRLAKAEFDRVKREVEALARERYPELKQPELIAASQEEKAERQQTRRSQKAQEMAKRGARLSKTEALAQEIRSLLAYAASKAELERLLADKGFTLYERKGVWGVRPIPQDGDTKKRRPHRFATLGIDGDFEAFLEKVEPVLEEERSAPETEFEGEKEKEMGREAPGLEAGRMSGGQEELQAREDRAASEPQPEQGPQLVFGINPDQTILRLGFHRDQRKQVDASSIAIFVHLNQQDRVLHLPVRRHKTERRIQEKLRPWRANISVFGETEDIFSRGYHRQTGRRRVARQFVNVVQHQF